MRLKLCEVLGNDFKEFFGDFLAGWQIAAMADLQCHVDKGVVVLAVGHAPGVQTHASATDATQGKHAAIAQRFVDFFEQAREVGLLFDVIGVLSNEVGHERLLQTARRHRAAAVSNREYCVDLAGARAAERLGNDLCRLVIISSAE
ncbi:hypothetical protein D3C71_1257100 [compost metagenome]